MTLKVERIKRWNPDPNLESTTVCQGIENMLTVCYKLNNKKAHTAHITLGNFFLTNKHLILSVSVLKYSMLNKYWFLLVCFFVHVKLTEILMFWQHFVKVTE